MVNNYKDLTVGQYLQIQKVCKDEMDELEFQVALISILSGKTEDEVLDIPIMEFKSLSAQLSFLNEDTPEATGAVEKSYRCGGYDLVPFKKISDMTTAQYIDFQELSKDAEGNMVQILSVFLIPKGYTYNKGYDIERVQEGIRNDLSIIDANEILAFFLQRFVSLIHSTLIYSGWMAKRMKEGPEKKKVMEQLKEAQQLLTENGDGFPALMQFPKPAVAAGEKLKK